MATDTVIGPVERTIPSAPARAPGEEDSPVISVPVAVLRAVAAMARNSKRQQAELGVALQRAGLTLDTGHQEAVLRHLCDTADVEAVIPLSDGGILLSVTAAGMERALR
jgi:hypothetical protein